MPVIPIENRVLILPDEVSGKTPGGILLPDQAKEKAKRGTVVAVGPGLRTHVGGSLIPMVTQVGDVVHYGGYTGSELEVDGKQYRLIREDELLVREPRSSENDFHKPELGESGA